MTLQIQAVQTTLQKPFKRPLDLYELHRLLHTINQLVQSRFIHLKTQWDQFLQRINGKQLSVQASYPITLDTTLVGKAPTLTYAQVSLSNTTERKALIDYLIQADTFTFREHFFYTFWESMLSSKARAFVAYDANQTIIGATWGFFTTHSNQTLFHIWSLSILPAYSSNGVGKALIQHILQLKCDGITLNVDRDNPHAKSLYTKMGFQSLPNQDNSSPKEFLLYGMPTLSPHFARNVVKDYVLQNASLCKLATTECLRHIRNGAYALYFS